jgi:signal-transduction protein with cAMP-binding, CBS, and nucleotidyltransferase domain
MTENNHEFILEKLFRGSIINYRTFFMEEDGKVYYRFARASICFALPFETLMEIIQKHPILKK